MSMPDHELMMDVDRAEYIEWAKMRALAYLERGDFRNTIASITSDLAKRDDTLLAPELNGLGQMLALMEDSTTMRHFIEGLH